METRPYAAVTVRGRSDASCHTVFFIFDLYDSMTYYLPGRVVCDVQVTLPTFEDSTFYDWIATRHVDTLVVKRRGGMDGAHMRDFLPGLARLACALEVSMYCPRRIYVHCDYHDNDVQDVAAMINRLIRIGAKEVIFNAPGGYHAPETPSQVVHIE